MIDLSELEEAAWERGYAYALTRIDQLEAEVAASAARIEQLEAALRERDAAIERLRRLLSKQQLDARPPARQENDDVFKGFRGNNEA
jgi:uncharacterized coiled-coil protein SlyX